MKHRQRIYQKYLKRLLDIYCSLIFILFFWWIYVIIAVLVRVNLGSPVLYKQSRPGKDEKIFNIIKFRTMTDERDDSGKLLPDEVRLTRFGAWLRSTSLDELPEIWLILTGKMGVIGPRPLLVRDMIFMSQEHRKRHTVRPGLSGLAQVKGRNDIDWETKLDLDVKYVNNITFVDDIKLIFMTVNKVLKREGITEVDSATATDYGDYLLSRGNISREEYNKKQEMAKELLLRR